MADAKLTDLTDAGAVADTDYFYLVTDTGGTPDSERVDALDVKTYAAELDINTQTGTTYTLALTDAAKLVEMNNASANTCTIPPNSSVAFPIGTVITVAQAGAGGTTIALGSGVTDVGTPTLTVAAQGSIVTLIKRATDEWYVLGGG